MQGPETSKSNAYRGSTIAILLTALPLLAYVLLVDRLGLSSTIEIVVFFLLLGFATKAYLVLSEDLTRPTRRQLIEWQRERLREQRLAQHRAYGPPAQEPLAEDPTIAPVEQPLPTRRFHF